MRNYSDAYSVAEKIITYGNILKWLSILMGGLILLGSLGVARDNAGVVLLGLIISIVIGGAIYTFGVFISAVGQFLSASLDTADNSWGIKEDISTVKNILNDMSQQQYRTHNTEDITNKQESSYIGNNTEVPQMSNSIISVHRRHASMFEDSMVEQDQVLNDNAIPVKVRRIEGERPLYQKTESFHCPQCNKLYEMDITTQNLSFKCIHCKQNLFVEINDSDSKKVIKQNSIESNSFESNIIPTQEKNEHSPSQKNKQGEQHFNIIFSGNLLSGYSLEDVKKNFVVMYKNRYNDEDIARLFFSGKSVIIKSQLDYNGALKFQQYLMDKIGGEFTIEPSKNRE